MAKQYGLIASTKKSLHPLGPVRPSVFGVDSDSDTETTKPTGLKTVIKRQDKLLREKAVQEDPTIFQYDELYDEMDARRKESKLSRKDLDKKPKYINKLLESADRRKREYERRVERQVQKERETEGDEFKDKESFVTSAYRAKLEEMRQLDEQEKREDYLEAIGDVTRQGNLDGFYRHLYDQKVLYEDETTKTEPGKKNRKYRKRDDSSDSDQEVVLEERTLQHLPSNLDADSDFSIDSSESEEEGESKEVKVEALIEEKVEVEAPTEVSLNNVKIEQVEVKVVPEVIPKIDIWKKRTIGSVFDEALRRYFERKSARESGTYIRPSL